MVPLVVRVPGAFRELIPALTASFAARQPAVTSAVLPPNPSGMSVQSVFEGEPADVVVSASPSYLDLLAEAGLAGVPVVIAGDRLVLLLSPAVEETVARLDDLFLPGVRVVLSQPVTDLCGQYAREALRRAGLLERLREKGWRGELLYRRGSPALVEALRAGEADVAVLYASEAKGSGLEARPLPPPLDLADQIRFAAVAVCRAGAPASEAREFLDFLTGADGQALLAQFGFVPLRDLEGATYGSVPA